MTDFDAREKALEIYFEELATLLRKKVQYMFLIQNL